MLLAGGIMGQGYQCGQLWGAVIAAGAQAFHLFGPGPQAETAAVMAAQRLVKIFRNQYQEINCSELTAVDIKVPKQALKFLAKGGPIRCFSMTAGYASAAFHEINAAFSEKPVEALSYPVSCAAMLAQKMGLTEMQTVMAAGLAGGIGLSGGACGALGAAIWMISLEGSKESSQFTYNNPKASAAIERFLESSGYEFECSKIVGRKFENVNDHASYLCNGGCSKIIEALAAHGIG
jgi:Putative redox-active protein (C_GCAxxG_C_C)